MKGGSTFWRIIRERYPNRDAGATRVPPNNGLHSDNKSSTQGRRHIYDHLYILNIILPLFYLNAYIFGLLSPDRKVIIILEPTSSKHVKLTDSLSGPPVSLLSKISTSSEPTEKCFICVHVHGFLVCSPSFCKKENILNTSIGFS